MHIHIDFETRSRLNIRTVGAYRYAEDPSTDVILFGFSVDGGPVIVTDDLDDPRLAVVRDGVAAGATLHAHNAQFERAVWRYALTQRRGWAEPRRTQWDCTAARAAVNGLPRFLEGAASAARLNVNKDPAGKQLIKRFSEPRKDGTFTQPSEAPEEWERFKHYNRMDVETERALSARLAPLHPFERAAFMLDSVLNDFGFPIDVELVRTALRVSSALDARARARARELTGGLNPTQRDAVLAWLREEGADIDTLQAQEVRELLKDTALPDHVRELLEVRLEASRAGVKKLTAMLTTVCRDARVRGGFMYYGANTGRASGRLVQPHNFPRGDAKLQDPFLEILSLGDPDLLELMFERPLETLSGSMRGFIAAPPGKRFLVADYSAIEARGLAWAAGQEDMLQRYRRGEDVYVAQAADVFGVALADVTSEQRRIGKNLVLGCGYQMSGPKFPDYCKTQGVVVSKAFGEMAVNKYRASVPQIVAWWGIVERAAAAAIRTGHVRLARGYGFTHEHGALRAHLPSGRAIVYPEARLEVRPGRYGPKEVIVYAREFGGRWVEETTYGGKLVENLVQATARDIMVNGMLEARRADFPVCMTVHDELVAEVDADDPRTAEDFARVICKLPEWAEGFPLTAGGFESVRYRKG